MELDKQRADSGQHAGSAKSLQNVVFGTFYVQLQAGNFARTARLKQDRGITLQHGFRVVPVCINARSRGCHRNLNGSLSTSEGGMDHLNAIIVGKALLDGTKVV
jgi:hypothetical protein